MNAKVQFFIQNTLSLTGETPHYDLKINFTLKYYQRLFNFIAPNCYGQFRTGMKRQKQVLRA